MKSSAKRFNESRAIRTSIRLFIGTFDERFWRDFLTVFSIVKCPQQ